MTIIYIEPFSGLSGDMLLSAFCSLTNAYEEIINLPQKLSLPDGKIEIQELNKNGIVCKHIKITDLNQPKTQHHKHHKHHHHTHHGHEHHHHHFSDYLKMGVGKVLSLFGKKHTPISGHSHHRGLKEINQIIENGAISENAKKIAKDIFHIIGLAESQIHNIPLETIHFHEVSGVDSILDIVGCAVLIDKLGISKTYSAPICTGFGMVQTQHGLLPVPAPATATILMGMPTYSGEEEGEKVTPTGAAILKYLNPIFESPEINRIKIAYGPGQKNFKYPNVVRVSILEDLPIKTAQTQNFSMISTQDAEAEKKK